jgi:hypothetical protein
MNLLGLADTTPQPTVLQVSELGGRGEGELLGVLEPLGLLLGVGVLEVPGLGALTQLELAAAAACTAERLAGARKSRSKEETTTTPPP